jgi:hypothetical protein
MSTSIRDIASRSSADGSTDVSQRGQLDQRRDIAWGRSDDDDGTVVRARSVISKDATTSTLVAEEAAIKCVCRNRSTSTNGTDDEYCSFVRAMVSVGGILASQPNAGETVFWTGRCQ